MFSATIRTTYLFTTVCSLAVSIGIDGAWQAAQAQTAVQWNRQLNEARAKHDFKKAVSVLDQWIAAQPDRPELYYARGCENFFAGNFRESVNDFDKFVELDPSRRQSLWERGVSQYFAGDYSDGAQQFVDYQSYHDQDVENSAFRYLCVAKAEGVKKAQETLLPIENDTRPGLMEVFQLYQGKATPQEVLDQLAKSKLTGQAAAGYKFYTLLYVGLYYDAHGDDALAAKYLQQAADPKLLEAGSRRISRYMWDTARLAHQVVAARLKAKKPAEN
ncbi:tetratricopeptide repeat protein [Blastopirellula marina]|uniref:Uncharacterized protein n=1 Tax=Blastopirellula marina TaxID=124 RepID=A0A2S8GUN8_9BACT|nr:tetratricopeptide repeat protein [Blastopirellula marina]PQO48130.1 hypothetical protein C5Y93_00165 [Blastopirellula marina]